MNRQSIDWFRYGGLRIRYVHLEGEGDRLPLLMFNGLGQSLESLAPLIAAMGGGSVIAYDVPGAGLSEVPRAPWRYCQHARLAHVLLNHLGIERVHVFGVSWGGGLAQQFVLQYPTRVERLILAAAVMGYLMVPARPRVYALMTSPRRFFFCAYMASIAGDIYGGDLRVDPAAATRLLAMKQPPSPRGYVYQAIAMYGWTSVPWLWRIAQPTLVLQGKDDPMVPEANARLLARLIPDSRLELIDCGHLFMLTRTDRIASTITAFTDTSTTMESNYEQQAV